MSTMHDDEILRILQDAVIAAVEASTHPMLPIKPVGPISFQVPNDQKYVELVFIPNNRPGDFWGNEKNYQGLFRIVLHWPNDSAGPFVPMGVLKSICSSVDKGSLLQGVTISDNPDMTGMLEQGSEILYPAGFRYQCFRS